MTHREAADRPESPAATAAAQRTRPDTDTRFPIVGLGASAGGLAAFEAFFAGIAGAEPGMSFVLVQHLAPQHKSILVELLQRGTVLQVFEVVDRMPVRPNCIYVIPPGYDMALSQGRLLLHAPAEPRGQRLPIDFFFESLAREQGAHAIGIVLSGTGQDGTLGVQAIKVAGGLVMAQSPASAEFDGMPRSAIAAGLVDMELPPGEMAAVLMEHVAKVPMQQAWVATALSADSEATLAHIFTLLNGNTGHDFSLYKRSTVLRRIERRMAAQQLQTLAAYADCLQATPGEADALFRDLLIGVTSLFRDKDAFAALEQHIIPKLLTNKPAGSVIRVWSAGCSTGEEAYSLAILLQERMEVLKRSYTVQIFATDIDSRAIATARAGLYPGSIAADISAQRLARFFTLQANGNSYRVDKGIRDMLVFSEQDLIKDPPFSRLDLISCRNLLIYLGGALQKTLMPMFHFALNSGGMLFLGSSEGIGNFDELFTVLDRKAKLYQRQPDRHPQPRGALSRFSPPLSAVDAAFAGSTGKTAFPVKLPLRALTEQALLQEVVAAAALVNGQGDLLYLHGRSGLYLELAPGEAGINNVLKMAREGLRSELAMALHKAVGQQETVQVRGLQLLVNGHQHSVNLRVRPLATEAALAPEVPLYLVILEDLTGPEPALLASAGAAIGGDTSAQVQALKQELRARDGYLQNLQEELESSTEELKSSNEEMQSVNEELQSTNEELETSKEELQSVNEELASVNTALSTKVEDLSRLNNDMNNLLAGSGIATVFVDHQLRILRFTPTIAQIINLIASDVGRPVSHILSNMVGYESLVADAQAVLDTLVPKSAQVQIRTGAWFALRIQPYRTLENVIEGVVITFVDISEMKRIEAALEKANGLARLAVVVRDAFDAITVQDLDGRTIAWNPGAERLYGWTEAQALRMNARERMPRSGQESAAAQVLQLSKAEILAPYRTQRLHRDGTLLDISMTSTALVNAAGQMYAVATTERLSEPRTLTDLHHD